MLGGDGLISTNHHVASASGVPLVTFQDGTALPARVVAVSESYDIAFLAVDRCPSPDAHVAPLGDIDAVRLGNWVITVGPRKRGQRKWLLRGYRGGSGRREA